MQRSWQPLERNVMVLATAATTAPCPRGLVSRRGGLRLGPGSHPDLPSNKPLWPLAEVPDAIAAFERVGAAVVEGQVYRVAQGDLLTPVERAHGRVDVLAGAGTWLCKRKPGETWPAYVARAAAAARSEIAPLTLGIEPAARDRIVVDLGWVTEDELSLFDLPGFVRQVLREAVAAGRGPWGVLNVAAFADGARVRFAGAPAPGSF